MLMDTSDFLKEFGREDEAKTMLSKSRNMNVLFALNY